MSEPEAPEGEQVRRPEEREPDPRIAGEKHPIARMLLIGAGASAVGVAIVLALDWFPAQGATAAAPIDRLYDVLMVVSVPIFVLVMSVAIYSVAKFRVRPGDKRDGAPIHGNTKLEVIWVLIPFVIVSVLAVYAWIVLNDIERNEPNPLPVTVRGQQFTWTFQYPQQGGRPVTSNELVLPVGRQAHFQIEALDVIHSFWVPEFRLKQDAVPGIRTQMRVTPSREGNYPVVCAELCGIGHSTMRQEARVLSQADFDAWLRERQAAEAEREGGGEQAAAGGDDGSGG